MLTQGGFVGSRLWGKSMLLLEIKPDFFLTLSVPLSLVGVTCRQDLYEHWVSSVCHLSSVTCQVSPVVNTCMNTGCHLFVTCRVSPVKCHLSSPINITGHHVSSHVITCLITSRHKLLISLTLFVSVTWDCHLSSILYSWTVLVCLT
jgi:hypothetical protein